MAEVRPPRRWPRWTRRLFGVVAGLYAVGCSGLYFGQDAILFPGHRTQGTADAFRPSPIGTESIVLAAADGTRIAARFRPAADAGPHTPTVLFFYGNAMCAAWCDGIVAMLHEQGCNVLVPDYLGYGQSGGKPSEAGCYATADAAWAHLTSRPDVDASRVVVMGWSLGAAVAIDLTSRVKPAGLITLSAFTSVGDVAGQNYPLVPARWLVRSKFDNLAKAPAVACPTLIVHGKLDTLIEPNMGERLHATVAGSELLWLPTADHNTMFEADPPTLAAAIGRLVARAVPPATTGPSASDLPG